MTNPTSGGSLSAPSAGHPRGRSAGVLREPIGQLAPPSGGEWTSARRAPLAREMARGTLFAFVLYAYRKQRRQPALASHHYLEAVCWALEQAVEGVHPWTVINIAPRHLKSFILVCLAAWLLGRRPDAKILAVFYGEDLARTHGRVFDSIVQSRWYEDLFPDMRLETRASSRWEESRTTQGGYRRSLTVGGAITGFGGDYIFCDDLTKVQDVNSAAQRETARRVIDEAVVSRFNDPSRGVLVAMQQRLHPEDIVAHLLSLGRVRHINLPLVATVPQTLDLYRGREWVRPVGDVLDPSRYPPDEVEALRRRNAAVFAAQYQQAPDFAYTAMIDMEALTVVNVCPPRHEFRCMLQFWDTAEGIAEHNAYSVGTSWGLHNDRWIMVDMIRRRLLFPQLKAAALAFADRWQADRVIVEAASSGPQLVQQLRHERQLRFQTFHVHESKDIRLYTQSDFLTSDRVAFYDDGGSNMRELMLEFAAFPEGRFADIVDSVTLFAITVQSRRGRSQIETILNGGVRVRRSASGPRPW